MNNGREFRLESKNQLGRSLDLKARDRQEASTWIRHLRNMIQYCNLQEQQGQRQRMRKASSMNVMPPSPPSKKMLQINRQQSKAHLSRINRHCWAGWLPSPLLPKLTSATNSFKDLIGTKVRIMWWRPDPDLYSYTNYFGRRRAQRSFKWRPGDKTDPPTEDSQTRWYTGEVQPFQGDNMGTSFIVKYVYSYLSNS